MNKLLALLLAVIVLSACGGTGTATSADASVEVAAEGLVNPVGLALLPNGDVLIAEEGTGENDLSAGVSLLTADGQVGRVVSGFPSSRDSGDLSGLPLVGVSPDGNTAFLAHFGSAALFTIDLTETDLVPGEPLTPEELGRTMEPLNQVELINPFDIAFSVDGRPVVSDASGNGVAIETPDGRTNFFHRFGVIGVEDVLVEPVPTGIARQGEEYLVTLTGGCPNPPGVGQLLAIDEERGERVIAVGLNMPIDVEIGPSGNVWVVQFAESSGEDCFSSDSYQAGTGSLSRVGPEGDVETLVEGMDFPGAVLPMPDGTFLVSEIFAGRILRISPDEIPPSDSVDLSAGSPWEFRDDADMAGLTFLHGASSGDPSTDPVLAMGGGVCWIDVDNDGWQDLYLVNSSGLELTEPNETIPRNQLYLNDHGQFRLADGERGANVAMRGNGCVVADLTNDGYDDLFITADGPDVLLANDGTGSFADIAPLIGLDDPAWSTAAVAGDINDDGRMDLFVGGYVDLAKTVENPLGAFPQDFEALPDHLYLSTADDGSGLPSFEEHPLQTSAAGDGRTLGALLTDLDSDGDLDLYIANDGDPNRLHQNNGGAFTDVTSTTNISDSGSGMGVAGGDFDGDRSLDLTVTNWHRELHAVYTNQTESDETLRFQYSTNQIGYRGLGGEQTGWGVIWADLDHDSDLDLFIANGHVPVTDLNTDAEPLLLYSGSTGERGEFLIEDASASVGLEAIGPQSARGAAAADYDNDGDLDIAVNVVGGSALLLSNSGTSGRSVTVDFSGACPGALTEALLPDGRWVTTEQHAGSSYLSSEDSRAHIGVGSLDAVTELRVTMPDGSVVGWTDVPAGSTQRADCSL